MINFCVEPKKPCRKNPIGELDFKIDKCYSSIYSRLCHHIDDSVSHISQEERDEWNGKASKEALNDIQDQLNKITGDESGSMKYEILLEVSKQITAAIDGLDLGDYAKKKYVDDAIKNIELDGYVTKDHADSTYLKIVDYKKIDPTSYYTKAEVQKIIEDSTIGKDYPIQSFTIEGNQLLITQKNGGQFRVNLSGIGSGVGVDTDYVQEQLSNYIKKNTLSKLVINDQTYSLESGRDIKIPTIGTGSSIDATKYGYSKSYFKEYSSNSTAPSKPSANRPPEDGSGWVEDAPNKRTGYYIWMTQVFINGNGQYGEYTNPICLTGTAGESAVSYDIKTSTSTINYQDGTMYPKTISVYVTKSNGSQITNITPSNSSGWSFSYSTNGGDAWTAISSDQIQTEGDNGMLFKATNGTIILSEYVPIVKYGINGSTNELVIFDDQKIVAGMTSNKAVDESSPLNGKVINKGDVRIWAGEMQTSGDLATAYTTIDSNGSIVMQNIQQGKSIKINPQECSFKIVGPVRVLDDSVDNGTYIPSSDERVELVNFEYTVDADSLSSAIRLIMKGNGMITIDPGAKEISVYGDKDSTGGSIIGYDSIDMYDDSGNLYTSFNGVDIAGRDFVTLTSRYNKKGLHLRRIDSAASNDILYILEGLPTSDPKIEGALWIDTDRTLKVSRRGFGS